MGLFDTISRTLFGNKDKFKQLETLTPEQQEYLSGIFSQLQGGKAGDLYSGSQDYLSQMLSGSGEAYNKFAAPFQTQFNEQVLPGIAERFAGIGGGLGGGAMGSSGFAQALGGAGTQFQSNLANLYAQLQQQAAGQAMGQYNNLSSMGLGSQAFENIHRPGTGGLVGAIGAGFGSGFGKPAGAAGFESLMNIFKKKK